MMLCCGSASRMAGTCFKTGSSVVLSESTDALVAHTRLTFLVMLTDTSFDSRYFMNSHASALCVVLAFMPKPLHAQLYPPVAAFQGGVAAILLAGLICLTLIQTNGPSIDEATLLAAICSLTKAWSWPKEPGTCSPFL